MERYPLVLLSAAGLSSVLIPSNDLEPIELGVGLNLFPLLRNGSLLVIVGYPNVGHSRNWEQLLHRIAFRIRSACQIDINISLPWHLRESLALYGCFLACKVLVSINRRMSVVRQERTSFACANAFWASSGTH